MPTSRFYKETITGADVPRIIKAVRSDLMFHTNLTDDGAVDYLMNEDYSSVAASATFTATTACVIQSLVIEMVDSDIAQNAVLNHELWVGAGAALTNGLKLKTTTSGGTTLLDIWETVPIKTLYQLDSISEYTRESSAVADATTGNNHHAYSCKINFELLFGKGIQLGLGEKFILTLNDDLTGLAVLRAHIWGYKL
jgi:hypothetical protein